MLGEDHLSLSVICRGGVEMMRVTRLGKGLIYTGSGDHSWRCVCHYHCWSDGGVGVGHSMCGHQHVQ